MTAADALFRLAAEVAAFHSRSTTGTITVVPVLVEDLQPARHVFEALCAVTDGRLLDVSSDELQVPVPGTSDPVRRAAVNTALVTIGGRRVELQMTGGGLTDATFVDPPAGPDPSGGERTVLAVARAVAHEALDRHELVVLMWADAAVDMLFRPTIWNLVVQQLSGSPHLTLKTLVAVAGTSIDVRRHCQVVGGFRLALENNRLVRRHGPDSLSGFAAEVAGHPGPVIMFLGAGFGASSRLPLGNAVRDQAIKRLIGLTSAVGTPSEELAHRFQEWMAGHHDWLSDEEKLMPADEYAKRLTLEQVVRAEQKVYPQLPTLVAFKDHHDSVIGTPGQGVLDLSKVAELMPGRLVIVEVNFDQLVEHHATVPTRVFASDDEFADAPAHVAAYLAGTTTDLPILKIHGSIERFDTCVITDDQTALGVGTNKLAALRALLNETDPTLWLFVGASMRDRDLARIFGDEDWARGVDERWVVPYAVDTIEAFAATRLPFWKKTSREDLYSRLTTETSDAFLAALRSALEV